MYTELAALRGLILRTLRIPRVFCIFGRLITFSSPRLSHAPSRTLSRAARHNAPAFLPFRTCDQLVTSAYSGGFNVLSSRSQKPPLLNSPRASAPSQGTFSSPGPGNTYFFLSPALFFFFHPFFRLSGSPKIFIPPLIPSFDLTGFASS